MSDEPRDPHLPGGAPPPPASGPITPPPGGGVPATPVPPGKRKKSPAVIAAIVIGAIVAVLLIGGIVIAVLVVATGGSYEANGVSFEYPKTWVETSDITTEAQAGAGTELWSDGVTPIEGSTGDEPSPNVVLLTAYKLPLSVTEDNVAQLEPQLKGLLDQLVAQQQASWDGALRSTTIAGLPAFVAENVGGVAPGEQPVESRVIFVFDDTTQYFINCQYETASKSDVLGGCDQITNTFTITG